MSAELTSQNATENNTNNSHAQDTNAFLVQNILNVLLHRLPFMRVQLSNFLCATTTKVKNVLVSQQQ